MNSTSQRGSALVWVLIVAGTLSVLGLGYSRLAANELAIAGNHQQLVDAYYIAQAGLEWGRQYIRQHASELADCANDQLLYAKGVFTELGNGMVEVRLERVDPPEGDFNWLLVASGFSGNAVETVSVPVRLMKKFLPFDHALAVGTDLTAIPNIKGAAYVEGSVEVPGSPGQLKRMGTVDGMLMATGSIDEDVPCTDGSELLPYCARQETILDVLQSEPDLAQLREQVSQSCDTFFTGNFTCPETINTGVYFVAGDVALPAGLWGSGLIYATGNIVLDPRGNQDVYINGGAEKLVFICEGDFTIKANASSTIAMQNIIIATRGQLLISGGQPEVYILGAVAASGFSVQNGDYSEVTLEYQSGLDKYQWLPAGVGGTLIEVEFGRWQLGNSTP